MALVLAHIFAILQELCVISPTDMIAWKVEIIRLHFRRGRSQTGDSVAGQIPRTQPWGLIRQPSFSVIQGMNTELTFRPNMTRRYQIETCLLLVEITT